MQTLKTILTAATAVGLLTACQTVNAALTISGSVGGAPTGVKYVNFDNLALGTSGGLATGPNGSVLVSFAPDGQAVQGSSSGVYAAPWLSGLNGSGFGPGSTLQPNGADSTVYLTSGKDTSSGPNANARVTLTFTSLQQYFGLLWGSIDTFNTLEFFNGNVSVGAVTGSQVVASPNGDQGMNGTLYVNINSTLKFDTVVATSTEYAFEFDNVAYNTTPVPEPTTVIAGALLLLPFGASTIRFIRKNRVA